MEKFKTPLVSVVIASCNAEGVISDCLSRLCEQDIDGRLEVIVADCSADGTPETVRNNFPTVQFIHIETRETLSKLRGRAIANAQGGIIAILDPYSMVSENWLSEVIRVHSDRTNMVIGGVVEPHNHCTLGLLSWATYINEYGMFMSPVQEGETDLLAGSNISYKRESLFDGDTPRYPDFWKTFVNRNAGKSSPLWLAPSIVVGLNKPIPFGEFLRTRFDHGRCFGAMRIRGSSRLQQFMRAITSPAIPFVLLWRWSRVYWRKRRYRSKLILTFPLQVLLFSNWALGEFVGYCRGEGKSCSRLYF